jgi:hypothetical protein
MEMGVTTSGGASFPFVEENCGTAAVVDSGFLVGLTAQPTVGGCFPCSKQTHFSQIAKTQIKGAATCSAKNERIENQNGLKHP